MSLFDDLTKSKSLKNIINTLSSKEDNEEQLKLICINLSDVLYVESIGNYVRFELTNQNIGII